MRSVTSTRMRTGGASRHDGCRSSLAAGIRLFAGGPEVLGEISH